MKYPVDNPITQEEVTYPVDNPITETNQDKLGRADLAKLFVKTLRSIDSTKGAVVSVMGPWGSGKTSFINLVKQELGVATEEQEPEEKPENKNFKIPVIEFNPWMFSGSEQLIEMFFNEIAAELKLREESKFDTIADNLVRYSDILSPIALIPKVGSLLADAQKSLNAIHEFKKEHSVKTLRNDVMESLKNLDRPILIVLDDIDRLSSEEIRDIFKLVRLTANFPNVIYLLAFDRLRVEAALSDTNVPGRDYLEKIIQFGFDLPLVPQQILEAQTREAIEKVVEETRKVAEEDGYLRFNENIWPDIFVNTVQPYISNLRDVRRLTLALHPTLIALGSEIETVDLIALETLRVFQPEAFSQLKSLRFALTQYKYEKDEREIHKSMLKKFIAGAGENELENLIRHLFPIAYLHIMAYGPIEGSTLSESKLEHRVGDIYFLEQYLEHFSSSGLQSFLQAEALFQALSDQDKLEKLLNDDNLENTLRELLSFESKFPAEAAFPASIVFLNLIPKFFHKGSIQKESSNVFDDYSRFERIKTIVSKLVTHLLKRLDSANDRETVVSEIINELQLQETYSTQLHLINLVRYKENVGLELVSEQFAKRIETDFHERVKSKNSPFSDKEWDLLRVLLTFQEWDQQEKLPAQIEAILDRREFPKDQCSLDSPDEIRSLFNSAITTRRFQRGGEEIIYVEEQLRWNELISIFNDEKELKTARDRLCQVDGDSPLIGLIDKYLGGWRPEKL